ncbi:hypothetical protein [Pelagibius sp. Alg239-R121]|uniref:hypothetical protein n=1 Tax=Pelagibius sp. Alg239-R121 TaxID=2993448 RepID=UPI0024A621D6|nr:hypothetical protein [Pelagibius sp. Alg239-R121]
MDNLQSLYSFAAAGIAFGGVTLTFFWKGEEALSPALLKWLSKVLKGAQVTKPGAEWPQVFGRAFDRVYGADALRVRFILLASVTSLLAVAFFFATYLIKLPDFAQSLFSDPFQREAVSKQIGVTTLFVNFVVDYLCLAYCREVVAQMQRAPRIGYLPVFLLKDLAMKVGLFVIATGAVYGSFASDGSFGGNLGDAFLAVPATLWGGLQFENISCVYIYSSIISSFWLWAYLLSWFTFSIAVRAPAILRTLKWALPLDAHPLRSVGLVAAVLSTMGYWSIAGLT